MVRVSGGFLRCDVLALVIGSGVRAGRCNLEANLAVSSISSISVSLTPRGTSGRVLSPIAISYLTKAILIDPSFLFKHKIHDWLGRSERAVIAQ